MRQREQFTLQWKDVDLERGLLILPETKSGGVQYVYLNEEARAILRSLNSWERSKWVFLSQSPASHVDPRHFHYSRIYLPAMKRVREQTGMVWTSWHDLRHSGTALVKRYARLSPSHLSVAVERVTEFGKSVNLEPRRTDKAREEQSRKEIPQGPVFDAATVTTTGNGEGTERVRNE